MELNEPEVGGGDGVAAIGCNVVFGPAGLDEDLDKLALKLKLGLFELGFEFELALELALRGVCGIDVDVSSELSNSEEKP
jgi:hypothetical protein